MKNRRPKEDYGILWCTDHKSLAPCKETVRRTARRTLKKILELYEEHKNNPDFSMMVVFYRKKRKNLMWLAVQDDISYMRSRGPLNEKLLLTVLEGKVSVYEMHSKGGYYD